MHDRDRRPTDDGSTDAPTGEPTDGTDRPTAGRVDVPEDDRPGVIADEDGSMTFLHEETADDVPSGPGRWIAADVTIDVEANR